MNVKILVFAICVEAIIYLLLYNLHDCTFSHFYKKASLSYMFDKVLNTFLDYYTKARYFFSKTPFFTLRKVRSVPLRISLYLLKKFLMENFLFCAVLILIQRRLSFEFPLSYQSSTAGFLCPVFFHVIHDSVLIREYTDQKTHILAYFKQCRLLCPQII